MHVLGFLAISEDICHMTQRHVPLGRGSLITKVLATDICRFWVEQARRARVSQIAQIARGHSEHIVAQKGIRSYFLLVAPDGKHLAGYCWGSVAL